MDRCQSYKKRLGHAFLPKKCVQSLHQPFTNLEIGRV